MRRRVLEELSCSAEPLTAYELADRVRDGKRVSPVVVYRALAFLTEIQLVHRVVTQNAFITCNHQPHDRTAPAFFVCRRCGRVTELDLRQI